MTMIVTVALLPPHKHIFEYRIEIMNELMNFGWTLLVGILL